MTDNSENASLFDENSSLDGDKAEKVVVFEPKVEKSIIPNPAVEIVSEPAGGNISIVTSNAVVASRKNAQPDFVAFDRKELDQILNVYGRRVAAGEWRDYGIDMLKDRAVFSIFRRSSEIPIYRVEKDPKLARKQGMYSVVAASGLIMKRGQNLKQVLRIFEKNSRVVEL